MGFDERTVLICILILTENDVNASAQLYCWTYSQYSRASPVSSHERVAQSQDRPAAITTTHSECDHHPTQSTICVVTHALELPERWIRRPLVLTSLPEIARDVCPSQSDWQRRQRVDPQWLATSLSAYAEPCWDILACGVGSWRRSPAT